MAKHQKHFGKKVIAFLPPGNVESDSVWKNKTIWFAILVVVLPLLYSNKTIDPNLTPRYIFLSFFILIYLLFFFIMRRKRPAISQSPIINFFFLISIAYGAWSIVSMFFAINATPAYYEIGRHFLNIILLFLLMIAIKQEEVIVLTLCKVITVMSVIQGLIGTLQFYGLAFLDIPGNKGAVPYGLMGHRNLFGSAQVLLLPFVIFVLYKAQKLWQGISIVAITGIVVSVFTSETRSAWFSGCAVVFVSFILVIIFSHKVRKKWITGTIIGIIYTSIIVAFILSANKESSFYTSVHKRVIALSEIKDDDDVNNSISARLMLWEKSFKLVKDHFFLGVGPGNWKLAIPAYNVSTWKNGLILPSRPHNEYIEVTSETGIPGGILYFSSWIVIAIAGFAVVFKSKSEDVRILTILMLAGLSAFAIDCIFSFPLERIEHSLYFNITAGIVLGNYAFLFHQENGKRQLLNRWLIAAVIISAFNLFMGYKKYMFEAHAKLARMYETEKRYEDVINEVEAGKNKFITIDPYGEPLEMRSAAAYVALKRYPEALEEIEIAESYHPNSARIYTIMGVLYANLKQYDIALTYYEHALKLTPLYEVALENQAGVYFALGNYAACIETINKLHMYNSSYQRSKYMVHLLNEAILRLKGQ